MTTRKIALGLLVIVLLLAWFWWRWTPGALESIPGDGVGVLPGDHVERVVPVRELAAPVAIEVTPFTAPVKESPVFDGIPVRVVNRETGRPLPGAVVGYVDPRRSVDPARWFMGELDLLDPEAVVDARGMKVVANERGIAFVPRPDRAALICCRALGLQGVASVRHPLPDEVVLEMSVPEWLVVRTVDATGRPVARVPIRLVLLKHSPIVMGRATTDASGRIQVPDPRAILRHYDSGLGEDRLAVMLGIPQDDASKQFLPQKGRLAEIVLELPGTGQVEVRVEGEDVVGLNVWLTRSGTEATSSFPVLRPDLSIEEVVRGVALFPVVPCGGILEYRVQDPEFRRGSVEGRVLGPSVEGARVVVNVRTGPPNIVCRLRLLGPDNVPLRRRSVFFSETPLPVAEVPLAQFGSDDDGVVMIPLRDDTAVPWKPRLIGQTRSPWERGTESLLHGEVRLPGRLTPGVHTLPDLTMMPVPTLVAGLAVDDRERPLAGVRVRVELSGPRTNPEGSLSETITDSHGRFAIQSDVTSEAMTLRAYRPGYVSESGATSLEQKIGAGAEVTLRFTKGSRVTGRLLLPEDALTPLAGVAIGRCFAPLSADGSFSIEGVGRGVHDLEVRFGVTRGDEDRELDGVEVLRLTNVAIDGPIAGDARLDPWDLRRLLHVFRIAVVDEEGHPVRAAGDAGTALPTGAGRWVSMEDDGELLVVASDRGFSLRVSANGYENASVALTDPQHRVVLQRGRQVTVTMDARSGFPEMPLLLSVDRRALSSRGGVVQSGGAGPLDASWSCVLRSSATRKIGQQLWVMVQRASGPGASVALVGTLRSLNADGTELLLTLKRSVLDAAVVSLRDGKRQNR